MLHFEIDKDIPTRVLCKEYNIVVIDVTHYLEDLEKAKEIAKFIETAPELLEVLNNIINVSYDIDSKGQIVLRISHKQMDKARKLINKINI